MSAGLPTLSQIRGVPRLFLSAFLITLTCGYLSGIYFVHLTTGNSPAGISQQFRGNESLPLEQVKEIKYPKSTREMLNIVHSHVTSFALIFFAVGAIFLLSSLPDGMKKFLLVEPFVATLLLFGGMVGVRYLPAGWALPLGILMMVAGITTFLVLLAMVGICLYEMWAGRPLTVRKAQAGPRSTG
ncbi:MAG: hypothetical protein D6715_00620 [Calditrichaeota bacterium]|nr:MAG: hypothetical protein D6715_00620 [Calditrichota bacterium]